MKIPKKTTKVKLGNFVGWLLSDEGYGRAVAPLDHCDENGNVTSFGISYAHFYPDSDTIMRFQEKIGTSKDFIILN